MIVKQILKEEIMKESVIYQDIQAEEAAKLVFRQLNRKIGNISQKLAQEIRELPVEQIENLGEALLEFESEQDLQKWLSSQKV
jgi:DNA-binding transcriptional regulator GbsR (MarR family)